MTHDTKNAPRMALPSSISRRKLLAGAAAGAGASLFGLPVASSAYDHGPQPMDASRSTMAIENGAEYALNAFIWYRNDVPHDVSEAYWRDVHGIMVVRIPGMWLYRQMRLAPNRADLWNSVPGVSFEVEREAQPHGIPHFLFRSEAEQSAFAEHPIIQEQIFFDERNFVSRVGSQASPIGGARTLVDRSDGRPTQGDPRYPTFAVCFSPAPGVDSEAAFHAYLTERVALPWSKAQGVIRLRVHALNRYDPGVWDSPGVSHEWPAQNSYLGWIEIAVEDGAVLRTLIGESDAADHARVFAAMHTYPVKEIYTMISAGQPTEIGLRGYSAVQTIVAAGAENQRTTEALRTVYGDVARGIDGR